jgi:hypothetical protein
MSVIEIDWNPNRTKLRQFALIWIAGFVLAGLLLAWRWGCFSGSQQWKVPILLWIIGSAIGLPGLLFPIAVRPVYQLWMAVTFPIGWVLSHAVLAVIYFGIFTLLGVVFRIIGRDPLEIRGNRQRDSYWVNRTAKTSTKRYYQQF